MASTDSTIQVTSITEGDTPTVYGTIQTTDSRGHAANLSFAVDTDDTKWVALGIVGSSVSAYIAYNDRLLPKDAPEEAFGYVFVMSTYEHNVMTEVQVSQHWWSEDDYEALRKYLLDTVLARLGEAREAASLTFRNIMVDGV